MGVAAWRRCRQLEEENRPLKPLVADLPLNQHMLQEVIQNQFSRPLRAESWCRVCGSAFWSVRDERAR